MVLTGPTREAPLRLRSAAIEACSKFSYGLLIISLVISAGPYAVPGFQCSTGLARVCRLRADHFRLGGYLWAWWCWRWALPHDRDLYSAAARVLCPAARRCSVLLFLRIALSEFRRWFMGVAQPPPAYSPSLPACHCARGRTYGPLPLMRGLLLCFRRPPLPFSADRGRHRQP